MSDEIERISQKIFGKPSKDVKFLMLTHFIHRPLLENEDCLRTGLYSWIPVFDGEVKHFHEIDPEEIKKYDIVHINLSGQDIQIVPAVREILGKNSKTKLVANNDYTVELWQKSFEYLPMLKREIDHADMLFGTEPNQVGTMEVLMERKIHQITHPCFTRRLKTLTPKRNLPVISVVSHRYDHYDIIPSLAVKGHGLKTRLIGYEKNSDPRQYATMTYYNEIQSAENYMAFCDQLQESRLVVDPFTLTSQSRVGWDCAALGVPLVGSDRNYSVQKCFPKTMVPPFNIKAMREMVEKLLKDEAFRKEVIDYAREAVDYVSYENSKLKYFKALEEEFDSGGK